MRCVEYEVSVLRVHEAMQRKVFKRENYHRHTGGINVNRKLYDYNCNIINQQFNTRDLIKKLMRIKRRGTCYKLKSGSYNSFTKHNTQVLSNNTAHKPQEQSTGHLYSRKQVSPIARRLFNLRLIKDRSKHLKQYYLQYELISPH